MTTLNLTATAGALTIFDPKKMEQPRKNVMDAFRHSSTCPKDPEVGFGTGSRPPLNNPSLGPGPGAYQIKSTMSKIHESNFRTPSQYTIRGRTKFGDPNEKTLSKASVGLPGPGQYDLGGKFLAGTDPRKSAFPKAAAPKIKGFLAPGPGSYKPLSSLGKQPLSTKTDLATPVFPKAPRPSLAVAGSTDVGPGEYGPPIAACEEQVDSTKPSCPTLKIGTGYKTGSNMNKFDFNDPLPGPGEYKLPGGVATVSKGAPFRNAPAPSLSGRTKFGSPFSK